MRQHLLDAVFSLDRFGGIDSKGHALDAIVGQLEAVQAGLGGGGIDLPPLTGSKCLVRETGHLGPRKKGTSRCPRSVFQSSRSLVTSVKQRFSWRKARRLARYAGISEYRNRVTIVNHFS